MKKILLLGVLVWVAIMAGDGRPYLVQRFISSMEVNLTDTALAIKLPRKTLAGNCFTLDMQHDTSTATAPTIASVGPNAWAQAIGVTGSQRVYAMVCTNCDPQNALSMTFPVAIGFVQFIFEEWANISQAAVATALDGTAVGATSQASSPVSSGSITTTQDGSLVKQFASLDTSGPFGNSFTAGSNFVRTCSQRAIYAGNSGIFSQYQIKTKAGAVNPTFTYSGTSNAADTIGYALKAANAGTIPPRGIRICGLSQTNIANSDSSVLLDFPHFGNAILITMDNSVATRRVSDGDNNSYTGHNTSFAAQGMGNCDVYLARNVNPNPNLNNLLIEWGGANTVPGFVNVYDIIDADANPEAQFVTAAGTQSVNADLATGTITPLFKSSLVILKTVIVSHTTSDLVIPTPANGGFAHLGVLAAADGAGTTLEQDNGHASIEVGGDLSARIPTWSIQHNVGGVGGWGVVMMELKSGPYTDFVPSAALQLAPHARAA